MRTLVLIAISIFLGAGLERAFLDNALKEGAEFKEMIMREVTRRCKK